MRAPQRSLDRDWRCQDQRPVGDFLAWHAVQKLARHDIAKVRRKRGEEQEQVAGRKLHAAIAHGEGDDEGSNRDTANPEEHGLLLAVDNYGKDAGGQRHDVGNYSAMRSRHCLHGDRRGDREAEDQSRPTRNNASTTMGNEPW